MSRSWCRVKPADEQILVPVHVTCPECGRVMRIRYSNHRSIVSLRGLVRVRLKIRRCESRSCGRDTIRHGGRKGKQPWRCRSMSSGWT